MLPFARQVCDRSCAVFAVDLQCSVTSVCFNVLFIIVEDVICVSRSCYILFVSRFLTCLSAKIAAVCVKLYYYSFTEIQSVKIFQVK